MAEYSIASAEKRMSVFSPEFWDKIQNISSKLIVFSMARNEMARIPGWLSHYRKIGCQHFVVVDNGSSDGTYEFLSRQSDVVIIKTSDSYGQANYGINWLNEFRAALAPDRWVLFADVDELLVYKNWPEKNIGDLINEVEEAGCDAVWAFLLDMYPDGPIAPIDPEDSDNLFSLAPCFDTDYHFVFPPKKPWETSYPPLEIVGGPRLRSLSTVDRELKRTWFTRFLRGQLDRFLPITPQFLHPLAFQVFPQAMPALFKSPLAKAGNRIQYLNGHDLRNARYFEQNAVMCHFKFLGDFSKRVNIEVERKEHYRGGAEYFRYRKMIETHRVLDFRYSGSATFESADKLAELGLLTKMPVENPLHKTQQHRA